MTNLLELFSKIGMTPHVPLVPNAEKPYRVEVKYVNAPHVYFDGLFKDRRSAVKEAKSYLEESIGYRKAVAEVVMLTESGNLLTVWKKEI